MAFLPALHHHSPRCRVADVSSSQDNDGRTTLTSTPSIYVAYPKIARRAFDDSSLQITSMTIENPTPDSVEMGFNQVYYSNRSTQPTLYPYNASFYLLDSGNNPAFASIRTSKLLKVSNDTDTEVPPQRIDITHMDEFTRYLILALGSENYTIGLRGHGAVSTGSMPKTSVHYDQNITMTGMFNLRELWQSSRILTSTTRFRRLQESRDSVLGYSQRDRGEWDKHRRHSCNRQPNYYDARHGQRVFRTVCQRHRCRCSYLSRPGRDTRVSRSRNTGADV